MTKVLNLDNIGPEEVRELQLKGKTYPVQEMSVEDFIVSSRLAEQLADNASFADQMEASIKLIKLSIPTIEESVLRSLKLEQLAAVSKFVRGEDMEEQAGKDGEQGKA